MLTPFDNAFHALLNFLGSALAAFYQVAPNYGVAIVLLTIATRLVLLPVTIKQTRSMQEMQRIQPELKKLQAKYKGGDKAKMNEEMMKMYKEHGVNPLGGCLPLLLQLPIFWALYRVLDACGKTKAHSKACLPQYVGLGHIPKGTSLYTALLHGHNNFLGMNLGLSPVTILHSGLIQALPAFVLVFLMVATTWYQQKQIMSVSSGQQADQMKLMGQIMPLLLGVFSLELATGISVYWVVSNVAMVGQQAFVLKRPAGEAPGGGAEGGRKVLEAAPKGEGPKGAAGAGNGRPGAPGKPGAGKPAAKLAQGAKVPQTAGVKAAGKAGGGDRAGARKPSTPVKGGSGNGAAKAGSASGGQVGKGSQRPAGSAPGKRGAEPGDVVAGKADVAPAGKEDRPTAIAGRTAKNGAPAQEPEPAAEVEVKVSKAPAGSGEGTEPGAIGNGAEASVSAEAGPGAGSAAARPRPKRAQPGDAGGGGGRKRRR